MKRLIHISAAGADPNSQSMRLRTKWIGEQEVKEILPELIGGSEKHGYKVSYDEMISVLFEAIKEQELILKDKDGELTELEGKFKRNQ